MKVSVIIPCYNEEEVLPLSHKRFSQVMGSTAHDYELIFVNDGSKDHFYSVSPTMILIQK